MNTYEILAEMVNGRKALEAKIAALEAPHKATIEALTALDRELLREVKASEEQLREAAEAEYFEAWRLCERTGGVVSLPVGVSASWSTVREVEFEGEVPREYLIPDVRAIAKAKFEIPGTIVIQKVTFRVAS